MNIIDVHVHIGPGFLNEPKKFFDQSISGDDTVGLLDRYGIAKAWVFPPAWGGGTFDDPTYVKANRATYEAVQQHPDRMIGLARVNPNMGRAAVEEFERCINEYGFRGMMLHSDWDSFGLNDPRLHYPLMEVAEPLGLPMVFHSGYAPADPAGFLRLARRFPSVPIVLKHMGYQLAQDAIIAAREASNIFLETSANWPVWIRHALRKLGPERILYGSDAPFMTPDIEMAKITMLPGLTDAAKEKILGGNALGILPVGLEGKEPA